MSAASPLSCEHHFLCSICLDVLAHPVSTPCGHNFCKQCITQHWTFKVISDCPLCKRVFKETPELNVNTLLSEVVAQFTREAELRWEQRAGPGEVPCDLCTGTRLKALKSCLVCLVSYCQTHLEPHLTVPGLKRHQLMEPVENLEGRMCVKHRKPLEMFCRGEQTCVCVVCIVSEHRTHQLVPLREEYEGKKTELRKMKAEIQQMIRRRLVKVKEIRECRRMRKAAADRETADGVIVTGWREKVLKQLMDGGEEEEAEGLINDLEKELCELMERSSEVEQLSHSEDHLHLLQGFSSLKLAPPTRGWTEVGVRPSSYEETVTRAQLEETLSNPMKEKRRFAVDVTLDPETAHSKLVLSDDGKQVSHGDVKKKLRRSSKRFTSCVGVVGREGVSSGKFYFEVQVGGKTDWFLGVCRESINRKGKISLSPDEGLWLLWLQSGSRYSACESSADVSLALRSVPDKLGVFVDYEEGLVSFYDVDTAALIYSFIGCRFNDELLPFFSPCNNNGGENSAPLVICPVNQPD